MHHVKQVTMRSPSVRKIALLFSSVYACLARFGFHKENCYDYTQNVQFEYQAETAFKNINLTIQEGECLLITGPSGSGKTTLGRILNGLIPNFYEEICKVKLLLIMSIRRILRYGNLVKRLAVSFKIPNLNFHFYRSR